MAKMKCDNCNNPATVHLTEIKHGKKIEKHLCEQCAAQNEGLPVKAHTPINELLTNFVLAHSGLQKEATGTTCDLCGVTWSEFRQNGLLGCEHDYTLFEKDLTPFIQRTTKGRRITSEKFPSAEAERVSPPNAAPTWPSSERNWPAPSKSKTTNAPPSCGIRSERRRVDKASGRFLVASGQ